ncbi:retropepsin-like aspartic protease family protein [Zooshikella sp. RANM57]|uniref:retropepsin-like aspartic protease family protein n=1 Tax=Zooshikella sp. RANM57 TaxID=3425863 RepID=UPI003D6F1648
MQTNPHSKLGKGMMIAGWTIALLVLTSIFARFESSQNNPNQQLEVTHAPSGEIQVFLKRNRYGHYVLSGKINQKDVTFLVDTGATNVSVPEAIADQLGMIKQGQGYVHTANGRAKVYYSTIQQLTIGDIELYDVPANINPHMDDEEVLLGMSALKHVEFTQQGNTLILKTSS